MKLLTWVGTLVKVLSRLVTARPTDVLFIPAVHGAGDHILITDYCIVKLVKFALVFIIIKLSCKKIRAVF